MPSTPAELFIFICFWAFWLGFAGLVTWSVLNLVDLLLNRR